VDARPVRDKEDVTCFGDTNSARVPASDIQGDQRRRNEATSPEFLRALGDVPCLKPCRRRYADAFLRAYAYSTPNAWLTALRRSTARFDAAGPDARTAGRRLTVGARARRPDRELADPPAVQGVTTTGLALTVPRGLWHAYHTAAEDRRLITFDR
jgi:hypothetical protein